MNMRAIAETFPPGEFLKEELEARGWSQIELAEILGRPPRVVSEIISGKRAITPETAKGLGEALGTSPELWLGLESAWQLSKVRVVDDAVSRRSRLYGKFPVKDLIRRGWIQAADNLDVLEKRFVDFFGLSTIDDSPLFPHAAKKTSYDDVPIQQIALCWRALHLAEGVSAVKYSKASLEAALEQLHLCVEHVEEIRKVPAILAAAGVIFVIVEALPGSKLDGLCFWINKNTVPVIALTLRFDRVDNFWHVLRHEIDHVLNNEGKDSPIVDVNLMSEDSNGVLPDIEVRANKNAANWLIPSDELEGFIARLNPLFSEHSIIGFAKRIHVHPGIVLGQLQNRGLVYWTALHKLKEKIRHHITPYAITDGFGQINQ